MIHCECKPVPEQVQSVCIGPWSFPVIKKIVFLLLLLKEWVCHKRSKQASTQASKQASQKQTVLSPPHICTESGQAAASQADRHCLFLITNPPVTPRCLDNHLSSPLGWRLWLVLLQKKLLKLVGGPVEEGGRLPVAGDELFDRAHFRCTQLVLGAVLLHAQVRRHCNTEGLLAVMDESCENEQSTWLSPTFKWKL